MTNEQLIALKNKLDDQYSNDYERFIKIIKGLFPDFYKTPYEYFLEDNPEMAADLDSNIIWQLVRDKYESPNYVLERLNRLLFPYLYENKSGISESDIKFIKKYQSIMSSRHSLSYDLHSEYRRFEDSELITYNNCDIIITDPGYVFSKDWLTEDWTILLNNYIFHDTIYGDWSASIFQSDAPDVYTFLKQKTKNKLGDFAADAGLVGVFDLNEVLKYDPQFEREYLSKENLVTRINNFTGTAQIKVGYDEENNDFFAFVEGRGNINFYGIQTGL